MCIFIEGGSHFAIAGDGDGDDEDELAGEVSGIVETKYQELGLRRSTRDWD